MMSRLLRLLFCWICWPTVFTCAQEDQDFLNLNCDPCIDRESYSIQVITHGVDGDAFWHQVRKASLQAAHDMRVGIEFELLPETYSEEQMIADINEAASLARQNHPDAPSALVVTIPSDSVADAIQEASTFIPIFGMNSGYERAGTVGTLGFVAMDGELELVFSFL